jgi:hypothetical protein
MNSGAQPPEEPSGAAEQGGATVKATIELERDLSILVEVSRGTSARSGIGDQSRRGRGSDVMKRA